MIESADFTARISRFYTKIDRLYDQNRRAVMGDCDVISGNWLSYSYARSDYDLIDQIWTEDRLARLDLLDVHNISFAGI